MRNRRSELSREKGADSVNSRYARWARLGLGGRRPLGGASRVPVPNAKSGIRMAMRAVSRGASRDAFKTEGYLQNHIKHAHQRRAP